MRLDEFIDTEVNYPNGTLSASAYVEWLSTRWRSLSPAPQATHTQPTVVA